MRSRNYPIVISQMFVLMVGLFSLPLLAQHHDAQHKDEGMIHVGKKGETNLSSPLRVGETVLKPGRYQFKHTMEGDDHVVAFLTTDGKEVARVKCKLEPLGEKAKVTEYTPVLARAVSACSRQSRSKVRTPSTSSEPRLSTV